MEIAAEGKRELPYYHCALPYQSNISPSGSRICNKAAFSKFFKDLGNSQHEHSVRNLKGA